VKYAQLLPLKLLPLPIAIPPMVEMLQWHQVHDCDPANQWFVAYSRKPSAAYGTTMRRPLSAVRNGTGGPERVRTGADPAAGIRPRLLDRVRPAIISAS
jgi:hypothetical protein